MISLVEAAWRIGSRVLYETYPGGRVEGGTITGVNDRYIFVKYDGNIGSKATRPEDLDWEHSRPSCLKILMEEEK